MQRMYGNFFPNLSSIISEKCLVAPILFLDSDGPCWHLLFPHSLNSRKNIVVLVGKFLKKPEYPKMRRTYAQNKRTKGGTAEQKEAPSFNAIVILFSETLYTLLQNFSLF